MRTNPKTTGSGRMVRPNGLSEATALRRAVTALDARARVERHGELTTTKVAVLGRLVRGGSMLAGEIAEQLRAKPQSLTRTFNALAGDGLIRRAVDPLDRRQTLIDITDAGRRALRAEMRPRDEWLADVLVQHTDTHEVEVLLAAAAIMQRLAELPPDSAPPREPDLGRPRRGGVE